MAIVGAVVLLVALVALGGYFLYQSLPGTNTSVSANASETSVDGEEPENMGALYIQVVGESSNVFVRVPGGDVLLDYDLKQGQSVNYNDAEDGLEVTIEDPTAVEVFVHGEEHDVSDQDAEHSFTIDG